MLLDLQLTAVNLSIHAKAANYDKSCFVIHSYMNMQAMPRTVSYFLVYVYILKPGTFFDLYYSVF